MNGRCVQTFQRYRHLNVYHTVGSHRLRHRISWLQVLRRIDAVVRLFALLFLLLFLQPLLIFLLPLLQALLIGGLGHKVQRIRLTDQLTKGIRRQIFHSERQRVLVDQRRVAKPVDERILLLGGLQHKG